jgi:hypothetical protein
MATKGTVSGVIANMVTLVVDGPVAQNEICYISTGGDRLMAEVIKVVGTQVYVQVFESTRGLKVGAEAEFTGHIDLSAYHFNNLRHQSVSAGRDITNLVLCHGAVNYEGHHIGYYATNSSFCCHIIM